MGVLVIEEQMSKLQYSAISLHVENLIFSLPVDQFGLSKRLKSTKIKLSHVLINSRGARSPLDNI